MAQKDIDSEVLISFKDATINNGENDVLYDVNLEVRSGELIYITGKVGGGKTSLARTITAENSLDEGQGEVLGHNLRKIRSKEIPVLRKKMGIVFQDFQLLMDRDVRENLEFVLRSTGWKDGAAREERIGEVLRLVGMTSKAHKFPHQLSGGQKQRICIARALLNSPKLILADEPTANLDAENTQKVMQIISDINSGGTTVIIITHRTSLIKDYPGREFVCEDEKFCEKTREEEEQ
ncbi:MAG: ATP-binding cassette domain-containing protein [Bacteroidales bacterium]|nr:ATP-binding cassette domain-containing protein [Bacteroidales bacterium]